MEMGKKYEIERDGQIDFWKDYLPRINQTLTPEQILTDYTDGVINGNILEFKLNINDLSSVLFQSIKYLSSLRIKGKSIPANIILVSLNSEKAFLYHSNDYLDYIEKIYSSGASKNNSGFRSNSPIKELDLTLEIDQEYLIQILKTNNFTKIHLDENCIVGWGKRFYQENPTARKADFIGEKDGKVKIIGEIRNPQKFKEFIYPYENTDNIKFRYLLDKLNDDINQKNLGAFYTPKLYAQKSLELVRSAISRVPKGNDYIILDRCAGTGNLEQYLTEEELSHTIVSTLEYYEYKVLFELLGDKVRHIIPPKENDDTFRSGLVKGSDALSKEFIESEIIQSYVKDDKCTIILFENPPFAETTSIEHQKKKVSKKSSVWKNSYVVQQMKKEVKGVATNDLGNAFIWSAFKYYLRQPTDSYIVFSPVKYWKAQHLINKLFIKGFAFNRKHFHTKINACIMCALWSNEDSDINLLNLDGYDIDTENLKLKNPVKLEIKKIYSLYSQRYYEKPPANFSLDGILLGFNGLESGDNVKKGIKPLYNTNVLGYLAVAGSGFDNPDAISSLLVAGRYNGHGFFLRKDNYLEKLPMFCASRYITYNRDWTERGRIMKSADGADRFFTDLRKNKLDQILLKCLLFTCLETQNHMRSFTGSDGRFYRNELCLDCSNGETIAYKDLKNLSLNNEEKNLIEQWNKILKNAKLTKNYDKNLTYGVFQIIDELNTFYKDEKKGKNVYDYPELNGHLNTLKQLVKLYYLNEIVPFLFEYEFLK